MTESLQHERFLRLALEQALLRKGACAPNPSVGAVLVQGARVLASGYHLGPGHAHAEQVVLSQAAHDWGSLEAATLYVTLEPCNHWGRTPPCVDAIIASKVKRVVFAHKDGNPVVAEGQTSTLLARHGIEVIEYPLPEIQEFYASYGFWTLNRRPWVSAKLALSLDGKIAGTSGRPVWLSNEDCHVFTHQQRRRSDWILTSAQTILKDNPRLTVRLDGQEEGKPLAILDRSLRLTHQAQVFSKASRVRLYYDAHLTVTQPIPQVEYVPVSVQDDRLVLPAILDDLGQQGAHDVWLEAGGVLFTAFHLAGLVQRTYLYLTPRVLGEDAVDAYRDKAVFQRQHSVSWRVLQDNVLLTLHWE
jgi:diaminohydroxyphosphoribosylaminopyrimidine deaminase/5-amino-6-(5-phosphoribosylamino)uracil reductase